MPWSNQEGAAVAAPGVLRRVVAVRIRGAVRRVAVEAAVVVAAEGRSRRTWRICCAAARTA